MSTLDILCVTPSSSAGWGPVTSMAELAGNLFDTSPRFWHPRQAYGRARKMSSLLPQARRGNDALLLIASHPGDLLALARLEIVLGRYARVAAWIFDSFWDDRLPLFARRNPRIDVLWVTDAEMVDTYRGATGLDVRWLPWGSDTLAAAAAAHDDQRVIDVLRLGRQPSAWSDDEANAALLRRNGLTYQGRFPDTGAGGSNQAAVRALLADAKVVLASSPLADPSDYTHPTRDYISARFTDAAAAGTTILGSPPRCVAADLLPDGLVVPMSVDERDAGMATIAEAVTGYTPRKADSWRRAAMRTLDWRHRFAEIALALDVEAPRLHAEMQRLDARLAVVE